MRPELGSASSIARAIRCPASTVLPRVEHESEEASRGVVIHDYLAAVGTMGPAAALAQVPPEHQAACEAIPLERLPVSDPARFRAEVAFAYDLDTGEGRELGQHLARDYAAAGVRESDVPGTTDVVAVLDDRIMVADYKSGFGDVVPAKDNLQLRLLALAACRAHGLIQASVAIIRLREDGSAYYDEAELGPFELSEMEALLADARRAAASQREKHAAGQVVDVSTGSHCGYCPAKVHCPAYAQLVARMATSVGDVAQEIRAQITPELAARAYQQLKMAETAIDQVKSALYLYALENPIQLPDGLVYGPVTTQTKVIDGDRAFAVLEQLHGREVADLGVQRKATQESLKRGLSMVQAQSTAAKKPPMTRLLAELFQELERHGGMRREPKISVKEHRPKPGAVDQVAALPE